MTQLTSYDTIVVGAGVEGSATAMCLARKGVKTLLLEQFELGHTRGSSHGGARTIRYNYPEDFYVKMMKSAYPMWGDIEKEAGVLLIKKTGGIAFGKPDNVGLNDTIASLRKHRIAHEVLSAEAITKKFPFLNLPAEYVVVHDFDAGFLYARRSVLAMQKLFLSHGGTILERHKVLGVRPGARIEVQTENGCFYCNSLVLCTGPWTNKVLACINLELALKPEGICVPFWGKTNSLSDNIPAFFYFGEEEQFYGMTDCEYPGLFKINIHGGRAVDPDHRDKDQDLSELRRTSEFIKSMIRGISTKPSIIETCMCTITPDTHPFMDRHPQHPNIIIGAGFSGHGFKLAPVVGSILSGLVLGEHIPYDMSHFKVGRFLSKSKL